MTTVAETVAGTLAEAGVRKVFGLPGGEVVELLDELRRLQIEFILVRNESSAAFMADAYARITGQPAVCMTTLGPGAANAAMGIAHCHLDRSPVVVITAQKPEAILSSYTHQVVDLHGLFRPITKSTARVHAGNARQATLDALALAQEGRPGPVHLQLSTEDAVAGVDDTVMEEDCSDAHASREAGAVRAHVERAASILGRASRPLVVAGLGLEPQRPYEALRAFAEAAHAPVITTPKAKGAVADSHPLFAGTIGLTRTDPVYQLVDEADCVVAVGFDVVELVKTWEFAGPLIWIAPWDNVDPTIPAECELVGDQAAVLAALAQADIVAADDWGERRVAAFRSTPAPQIPPVLPGRISPQAMLRIMREVADPEALLAVDVGSHKIFSCLEWPSFAPNRFLVSNGLSSMSFALPAAAGAAEALPGAQLLCLTGDAGLAMNAGELGVLAERNLPVVVVVLNDGAIDLIRSHQQRAGKPVFGTEFVPPRFDQIGAAFGIDSCRVDSEKGFAKALQQALAAPAYAGAALIEVMLDPSGYPTTPHTTSDE